MKKEELIQVRQYKESVRDSGELTLERKFWVRDKKKQQFWRQMSKLHHPFTKIFVNKDAKN